MGEEGAHGGGNPPGTAAAEKDKGVRLHELAENLPARAAGTHGYRRVNTNFMWRNTDFLLI